MKLAGFAEIVAPSRMLHVGRTFEKLTSDYRLAYNKDGRHRLLLFFSPNCPYCQQQSPLWRDRLITSTATASQL